MLKANRRFRNVFIPVCWFAIVLLTATPSASAVGATHERHPDDPASLSHNQGGENKLLLELSDEERAWLAEHPEIVLGAPTNYPPMVIKKPEGTHVGVLLDFFEQISQRLNSRISLHIEDSWADIQEKAQNREIDGLAVGGRDPSRAAIYNATDVLFPTYFSVFARSQNEYRLKRFSDLKGMRIGYKRAARPTRSLLEKLPSAILKPYDSHESMTQALLSKEIDVIVAWMSYDHWRKTKLQGTIDNILLIEEYPIEMVAHIRKDWPELIPILNKAIAALQHEDLPHIINKWFGEWPRLSKVIPLPLTSEERAWLGKKHTVRLRIVDWPPYQIVVDNKPSQGIVIEYLKLIKERTGIKFKYEVTDQPFAEFLESMKQGQGPDMTPVIVPTPELEQFLSFSEPYISSPYVIFIREQDDPILDIRDLVGKTLAVPRGHAVQEKLDRDYPEISQTLFDSDEKALQAVATGQADAYIGNLTAASHIAHQRGLSDLKVAASSPFGDQTLSMGNRRDWPELTSIINKTLASISEEERTAIRNKYLAIKFEQGINKAEVMKWTLIVGGAAFGIVFLFIFWNRSLAKQVQGRTLELTSSHKLLEAEINERKQAEKTIQESRDFLKRLTDSMADAVFSVKMPERKIEWANDTFKILGYEPDECVGKTTEFFYPNREGFMDLADRLARATAEGKEVLHIEQILRKKNGEIFPADITISLFLQKGELVRITGIVRNIAERKQKEQQLQKYQQRLKALAFQLTIAEEKERRAIAADLHDHVGQSLALARIQLASARKSTSDSKLAGKLDDISDTLLESLEDTQQLMFELSSPTMNEIGLSSAISEWLEMQIGNKYSLKTEFIDNIPDNRRMTIDSNVRAILFRNVRELLINAVKHARANKVSVRLEDRNKSIRIIVEDDGIGFDPRAATQADSKTGGFGLFSIEELMADLGGNMKIVSEPGKGCTAILSAPFSIDDSQERD